MEVMNQVNQVQEDEIEIDLKEIAAMLLRKSWLIILVACLTGGLAFGYTQLFVTPQYTASSSIYVVSKSTNMTSLSDIQLSSQLTADYTILASSRPVVEEVMETLSLDTDYDALVKMITIENPNDTHVLTITVTNPDPVDTMHIANTMADVISERVASVMATEKPSNVERAVIPLEPSSPSVLKNVAIGVLAGMFLVIGILVVLHIVDDTIKNDEDVEKYLNKIVFATLPRERIVPSKKSSKNV